MAAQDMTKWADLAKNLTAEDLVGIITMLVRVQRTGDDNPTTGPMLETFTAELISRGPAALEATK